MLALVADVVWRPTFPAVRGRDRGAARSITAIRQDEDSPAVVAVEGLMALLYPDGHPYGRRTTGTLRGGRVDHARRLVAFHARAVRSGAADGWSSSATSPPSRAIAAAERAFGDWHAPASPAAGPAAAVAARSAASALVVPMMNKAQADVAYGFATITRRDPDVLRAYADEQRAWPVRARRPAGRQHPRAAGHGVLRLQLLRRATSAEGRS